MSASSVRSIRLKHVVFAAIAAMAAYVLYHNESFLLNAAAPVWKHYEPFKWWLLPHGLAGACALILAPMQFAEGFRRLQPDAVGARVVLIGVDGEGDAGSFQRDRGPRAVRHGRTA